MSNRICITLFLAVMLTVSGCVGGSSPGSVVDDITTPPNPPLLAFETIQVLESRVGYGNVPGIGTYFEYKYDITGKVLNAGGSGQFKIDVYALQTNIVNPPEKHLSIYGPANIEPNKTHPFIIHLDTGEAGYFRFYFKLYLLDDQEWKLVEEQVIDRIKE